MNMLVSWPLAVAYMERSDATFRGVTESVVLKSEFCEVCQLSLSNWQKYISPAVIIVMVCTPEQRNTNCTLI